MHLPHPDYNSKNFDCRPEQLGCLVHYMAKGT